MVEVNVHEAKTHLSRLIKQVEAGEQVVISRAGRPVVRLEPVEQPKRRELGKVKLKFPDEFFAPLTEEELRDWE